MRQVERRIGRLVSQIPLAARGAGPLLVEMEELKAERLWILNQWRTTEGGPPYPDAPRDRPKRTVPWFAR